MSSESCPVSAVRTRTEGSPTSAVITAIRVILFINALRFALRVFSLLSVAVKWATETCRTYNTKSHRIANGLPRIHPCRLSHTNAKKCLAHHPCSKIDVLFRSSERRGTKWTKSSSLHNVWKHDRVNAAKKRHNNLVLSMTLALKPVRRRPNYHPLLEEEHNVLNINEDQAADQDGFEFRVPIEIDRYVSFLLDYGARHGLLTQTSDEDLTDASKAQANESSTSESTLASNSSGLASSSGSSMNSLSSETLASSGPVRLPLAAKILKDNLMQREKTYAGVGHATRKTLLTRRVEMPRRFSAAPVKGINQTLHTSGVGSEVTPAVLVKTHVSDQKDHSLEDPITSLSAVEKTTQSRSPLLETLGLSARPVLSPISTNLHTAHSIEDSTFPDKITLPDHVESTTALETTNENKSEELDGSAVNSAPSRLLSPRIHVAGKRSGRRVSHRLTVRRKKERAMREAAEAEALGIPPVLLHPYDVTGMLPRSNGFDGSSSSVFNLPSHTSLTPIPSPSDILKRRSYATLKTGSGTDDHHQRRKSLLVRPLATSTPRSGKKKGILCSLSRLSSVHKNKHRGPVAGKLAEEKKRAVLVQLQAQMMNEGVRLKANAVAACVSDSQAKNASADVDNGRREECVKAKPEAVDVPAVKQPKKISEVVPWRLELDSNAKKAVVSGSDIQRHSKPAKDVLQQQKSNVKVSSSLVRSADNRPDNVATETEIWRRTANGKAKNVPIRTVDIQSKNGSSASDDTSWRRKSGPRSDSRSEQREANAPSPNSQARPRIQFGRGVFWAALENVRETNSQIDREEERRRATTKALLDRRRAGR